MTREFVIIADEAWLPADYEKHQRRLEARRERDRRPDRRAYFREWSERNREKRRAYNREWMRRKRASLGAVGYLHELACDGQHFRARKRCKPIPVYRREDVAA